LPLPDLTHELETAVDAAIDTWQSGRVEDAVSVLSSLARENPEIPQIHGLLGGYLWEDDRPDLALPFLRHAISLAPDFKLASISLGHALLATGEEAEAVSELERFLELQSSPEHSTLLQAIRDKVPAV
jgi:predicted Zn-dependent protease